MCSSSGVKLRRLFFQTSDVLKSFSPIDEVKPVNRRVKRDLGKWDMTSPVGGAA